MKKCIYVYIHCTAIVFDEFNTRNFKKEPASENFLHKIQTKMHFFEGGYECIFVVGL